MTSPAIRFSGVSKTWPNGTVALSGVTFDVAHGTIHAICGENGAGKSTLMKILYGLEAATEGQVLIAGKPLVAGRHAAADHGIGMVHQHFSLIPGLSVLENLILGNEPRKSGLIDAAAARRHIQALMDRFQLHVDPDALVSGLSVAAQQKVEILKALSRETRILILDEPTAVLSPPETEELFHRLRALRDAGMTILFISHKLNEVRALAQSVSVLRAGRYTGTATLADASDASILTMVMGEAMQIDRRAAGTIGAPVIRVDGLSTMPDGASAPLKALAFTLHEGEILGVAGVDGSGQEALAAVLSGAAHPSAGSIHFAGHDGISTPMNTASTAKWRRRGMAHLPADRYAHGGAAAMILTENAIAGTDGDRALQSGPFLKPLAAARKAAAMVAEFGVRCLGIGERLDSLSGGNAQKLIAARELARDPKFLIADQPTRGIDLAAAAFLHSRFDAMTRKGGAVLLITADLDELLRLSDRILVLHDGEAVAVLDNSAAVTPQSLGPYMLGLERH